MKRLLLCLAATPFLWACDDRNTTQELIIDAVSYEEMLTAENWETHPSILRASSIIQRAESLLGNELIKPKREFEQPFESEAWSWETYIHDKQMLLIVERWSGSIRGNKGSRESRNYYDQSGKLVFTDFSFKSDYVDGKNFDWSAKLYFDSDDESLIWVIYKQVTPPGLGNNQSSEIQDKRLMSSEYVWDLLPFPFSVVNSPESYRINVTDDPSPNEDEYVIKSIEIPQSR